MDVEDPNVLVIPPILMSTDLATLIPWHFAERFAEICGIRAFKLPMPHILYSIDFVWHRSFENDPEMKWSRELCVGTITAS